MEKSSDKKPKDILDEITKLTSHTEYESLVLAFFDLIFKCVDSIDLIALCKCETIDKKSSLRITHSKFKTIEQTQTQQDDEDFLKHIAEQSIKNYESISAIADKPVLLLKINQDNSAQFFLVFRAENKFSPSEEQLIRHLSQIYSNHQLLITLNDKDSLTGLFNRKYLDKKMTQILIAQTQVENRRRKDDHYTFLAFLDIDHFKAINDTYGHLIGDEVLLHFSQQMQVVFRDEDLLFRYGGEEFLVLLKNVPEAKILDVLHRFRQHIEDYDFPQVAQVTVSIGVAKIGNFSVKDEVIDRADSALYYVKNNGRNNVGYYENMIEEGLLHEIASSQDIEIFE